MPRALAGPRATRHGGGQVKVIGINGSPRKNWNTATLLGEALEGAAAEGADTELIHLYDLVFRGCTSCFSCKIVGGKSYGRCAMNDDLTPFLRSIEEETGAIVMGTPIYFESMTGAMRSFLERFLFPYYVYSDPPRSAFPRTIRTAMIYTMNYTEEMSKEYGYDFIFNSAEDSLRMILGSSETLCCFDTLQFEDYAKVAKEGYGPGKKLARREEVFPHDRREAFELGGRLALGV